jgi:hypothetical protein
MKLAGRFLGAILFAMGAVWFFQGVGVLPGSFMTGQTRWAVIGAITAAVGASVWRLSTSRR